MLFGGSDRKCESQDVFLLEIKEQIDDIQSQSGNQYELKRLKTRLCEPDWFYQIGTGMRDPVKHETLLIMGERKVHIFDMKKMEFISCLDDEECFLDRRQ